MVPGDGLLERELQEARERQADYRARLTRHRGLSAKLRTHAAMLREALKEPAAAAGNVTRLLANVARLSGQALGIPRTSIWLFDDARENLICRFRLPDEAVNGSTRLAVAACPAYIMALASSGVGAVAVNDSWRDPRTAELGDYLRENHVGALLDIPVIGPGALHGVLCHEHQGGPRVWQEEEIDFATNVGAMVALALEAERRLFAERATRWTEAKYEHLVESLPVTVYSFHAKTGTLEYLSPRIVEMGGLGPEQYLVSGGIERWIESIEPEDREPVRRRLSGGLADGFTQELIYRIRLPDGHLRWVRDSCAVVRDATGRPMAVQGTLADITGLKEAELTRAEIERRYRTLLENVDLLAVMLDATGHIEFVNDCFQRATGFSKDELVGADGFAMILPPDERERVRQDFIRGIRKGKILPRLESDLRTVSGANRRILWTNTVQRSPEGAVIGSASLGVDITDRLAAETTQLQRSKMESLGRLAAGVAHDFNNLLTIISSAAAVWEMNPGDSGPAADINEAVRQATGLTRSLLAYARRESIAPTLLSVDELIASTFPILRKIVGRDLKVTHHLGAPSARVVMDETQLRQVLINLVSNAADATRGHGSELRVSTDLILLEPDQARARGLIAEGTFLDIKVADDGRGMTPQLVERAFDPFFTTKEKGQGTGLGLAMCASIVHRAGGFISVESEPSRGTTFHVQLPAAESAAPTVSDRPHQAAGGAAPGTKSVLVVEDVESIRNLVIQVLSGRGLEVLEAPDLATARGVLAHRSVDLLLTDGSLCDGDGSDLAREAQEQHRSRRTLLITGSEFDHDDNPFDAIVIKPFRLDQLIDTVLRLINDGSAASETPARR